MITIERNVWLCVDCTAPTKREKALVRGGLATVVNGKTKAERQEAARLLAEELSR
jgi:hypothetical protein